MRQSHLTLTRTNIPMTVIETLMDYIVKSKGLFNLRGTARLSGSNRDEGETLCLPAYS
jgi:hypothetical protein